MIISACKPFKIKTMNSVYELDGAGLWQNGLLYCETKDINEVYFTNDVFGYGDKIKIPTIRTMLYVSYGMTFIRTSLIMEVLSA